MIPKTSPPRFTASRQLIPGSTINHFNDALFSAQGITALGVAQGDAVGIDAANVEVLAGSANNTGVRLPVSYPGAVVRILNNSANTTIVYATGSDQVQTTGTTYAAAAAGVNMATLVSAVYFCIKTGFWQRLTTA